MVPGMDLRVAGMTTTVLLILSGVLIGTGVSLIWRDVHRRRRDAFVLRRDPQSETEPAPDLEITIARRGAAEPRAQLASAGSQLLPPEPDAGDDAPPRLGTARSSALAKQWSALQPVIGDAVEQVNAVLAGAGVAVGSTGEASWSLDRGYGAYRRILVAGESLAWLRLELDADGNLQAGVKAHKEDMADINGSSSAPAQGLTTARASDLLSECLKPAAAYAVRAGGGGGGTDQQASEAAWKTVDAVVVASLKAANGALAQAGARLMPLTLPTWDPGLGHHRMTVAVEVFGNDVARMHIERLGQEMEVAVGVAEAHLADLGRRRRIPVQGMTTHALAELIASCAWPAIARSREAQGQA
jgi:hypothetical protein